VSFYLSFRYFRTRLYWGYWKVNCVWDMLYHRQKCVLTFCLCLALHNNWHNNGNMIMKKRGNKFKSQMKVNEWLNPSFCHIAQHFVLTLSSFQPPNIPLTAKRLQHFIAIFIWPQAHTVALSQYTEILRHNILYCPLKTDGLLVISIFFMLYPVKTMN
jgi:hypothetical protein